MAETTEKHEIINQLHNECCMHMYKYKALFRDKLFPLKKKAWNTFCDAAKEYLLLNAIKAKWIHPLLLDKLNTDFDKLPTIPHYHLCCYKQFTSKTELSYAFKHYLKENSSLESNDDEDSCQSQSNQNEGAPGNDMVEIKTEIHNDPEYCLFVKPGLYNNCDQEDLILQPNSSSEIDTELENSHHRKKCTKKRVPNDPLSLDGILPKRNRQILQKNARGTHSIFSPICILQEETPKVYPLFQDLPEVFLEIDFIVGSVGDIAKFCEDRDELLAFLQCQKLVPSKMDCPNCQCACGIYKQDSSFVFKCENDDNGCQFLRSINKDTWFDDNVLSYEAILTITYCFVFNCTIETVLTLFKLSKPTIIDWYNACREICITVCTSGSRKLGGIDQTVELDESKFGKGRCEEQWVYGGIDRESKKSFFIPVDGPDVNTLLRIIKENINPGTTIVSDCWTSYNVREHKEFCLLKKTHDIRFKVPETIGCTNMVESMWLSLKRAIVGKSENLAGYMAAQVWRRNCDGDKYSKFLKEIANLHPL